MANAPLESPSSPAAKPSGGGSFFREWVVPVALGLAVGGGGVWLWREFGRSDAQKIVDRWRPEDGEAQDRLAQEMKALGHTARGAVHDAFLGVRADNLGLKIWVGHVLAGEPFFDAESLKQVARDAGADAADRRAAACVLTDVLLKEIDPELVLPVFEEWMRDLSVADHVEAVLRVEHMWRSGMLNSSWEDRAKAALVPLGDRETRAATPPRDDADFVADDRAVARYALGLALPDEQAKQALWATALDEQDDDKPRIASIRALAEGRVFDGADMQQWQRLAKSASDAVRQTVADNLFRTPDPEYDRVIVPLETDANPWTRSGAIDTQIKRRRPTPLDRFDLLIEDHEPWVRFQAMMAAAAFKSTTDGLARRAAMMTRLVESATEPTDVAGAVIALYQITGDVHGFRVSDLHLQMQDVEEAALKAFMADPAGRRQAADAWRQKFGAACVWTDEDRAKTLEKLLSHADPANVERAKAELGARKGD